MNILILGATGFIGAEIAAQLAREGHRVTGLGRSIGRAAMRNPDITWLSADLGRLSVTQDWSPILAGMDVVVNCAGALQDGLSDKLSKVQTQAQLAMHEAARRMNLRLIVQISAETEGPAGKTAFLATKRIADDALARSGLPYVILRPALVIGRNAFGGTALLRALASFPMILPLVHAQAKVATVTLDDVTQAVSRAIGGELASGSDVTLATDGQTLAELVTRHRAWLGLPPAPVVPLPAGLAAPVSLAADALGWLGWRSPLRSTAMQVMRHGIPSGTTRAAAADPLESAAAFLARNPAGVQDLWFARLYLLKPLIFLCLAAFWIVSGLIPFLDPLHAAGHFAKLTGQMASLSLTYATCTLDVILDATVLYRPRSCLAICGMMVVTLAYLAGAVLLEPALWLDPLGPMVKTIPALFLAVVALAILDER